MTTTPTPKPYEGAASVAAIIGLAKRSAHVRYRPKGEYGRSGGVFVKIGGRGMLMPSDYGKPVGSVYPSHKATEVSFYNGTDDARKLTAALAGFEGELEAAGWEVVKHGPYNWVVVGPLWKEWMRGMYDTFVADKAATDDRNARAKREAVEITRLLASRGVTGKYVENYGSARVTLYLADIEKLIGENHDNDDN